MTRLTDAQVQALMDDRASLQAAVVALKATVEARERERDELRTWLDEQSRQIHNEASHPDCNYGRNVFLDGKANIVRAVLARLPAPPAGGEQ